MPSVAYGSNTYVPSPDATGNMVIGFSRNQEDFPLNQYSQIVPVKTEAGLYWEWTSREGARILSTDDREHLWPDGQDAPHGADELETFQVREYRTRRYAYPFTMGDLSIKQAELPIVQLQAAVAAQKAMTARTLLLHRALSTYSWSSIGHLMGVNGGILPKGQGVNNGSRTAPNLLKVLNRAEQVIHRDTLGAVRRKDLILVVGPLLAAEIAESPEIHEYFAFGPSAAGRATGTDEKLFGMTRYGLPPVYHGFKIIVEDTMRVSNPKSTSSDTPAFVLGANEAYVLSRPGGIEGVAGSRSTSTVQIFAQEEFTVELKNDPDNRRTRGRVVTNIEPRVVSPMAGVRLTDLLSNDSSGI